MESAVYENNNLAIACAMLLYGRKRDTMDSERNSKNQTFCGIFYEIYVMKCYPLIFVYKITGRQNEGVL